MADDTYPRNSQRALPYSDWRKQCFTRKLSRQSDGRFCAKDLRPCEVVWQRWRSFAERAATGDARSLTGVARRRFASEQAAQRFIAAKRRKYGVDSVAAQILPGRS
jgi:hypothetical protein